MRFNIKYLLFYILFFMFICGVKLFAQEIYYTVNSSGVRSFVFTQLTNDEIYFDKVDNKKKAEPILFTQNNGKKFFIFYLEEVKQKRLEDVSAENLDLTFDNTENTLKELQYRIRIISDQNANNVQNIKKDYGTWDVVLDLSKSLDHLVYYFQDRQGYYINFFAHGNSTNISVYIEDIEYISNVNVPYSLAHLMRMPLDDITSVTRKYIKWNAILPQRRHFENYEIARQFAVYIENKRSLKPDSASGSDDRLYKDLQNMLSYIGSVNDVDSNQFFPIYGNKQRVPVSANDYLQRYTQNVLAFLSTLPEFQVQLPNQISKEAWREQKFSQILFRLYLFSLKYPKVWYLVLLGVEFQSNENREEIYNNVHVTIPYFTPAGKFKVFFSYNIEKKLLQSILKTGIKKNDYNNEETSQFVPDVLYLFKIHSVRTPVSNAGAREYPGKGIRFGVNPKPEVLFPPKTRFDIDQ